MNNILKKFLTVLLALSMVLGTLALVSCANEQQKPDDSEKDPSSTQGTEDPNAGTEDPDNQEEARIPTDLPTDTYNGETFHILEWTVDDQDVAGTRWMPWEEAAVDSRNGDTINDSLYQRNAAIEELYDVTISKEYASVNGSYLTTLRSTISSNDDTYQLITLRSLQTTPLMLDGLLRNLAESEYIDFEKPWWNQDSVESLALGSNIYWAASEFLLRDKAATACIFYNAELATDNGIDNLYDLAENGDWTMEELADTASIVATENGDSVWDENDIWGAVCGDDTVNYLYNGAGLKFGSMDEDGYFVYNFGDEHSITVLKDIFDTVMYADFYANTYSDSQAANVKFEENNVLYRFGMIKDVITYRQMESNYGVLPIPKYSADQESYSSLVWMHHDSVLAVPTTVQNGQMVEVVLEALSAESYYTVYRDFYDTVIMGRSTRDQESKEMLEIVFTTRSYDPGLLWDDTGFANKVLRLSATGGSDIASLWGSYETAIGDCVDTVNEQIADRQ